MKFYYLIGRLLRPFRQGLFAIYNYLFHVPRARLLVWNEYGELLLVRNWGREQVWGLPGGGVQRGEEPIMAAVRELYEEVGVVVLAGQLIHVATLAYKYEAPIYSVTIQKDALPSKPHNPWEIIDTQWFLPIDLPTDLSPLVLLALKKLSKSV